jgi:hypothetical protein
MPVCGGDPWVFANHEQSAAGLPQPRRQPFHEKANQVKADVAASLK